MAIRLKSRVGNEFVILASILQKQLILENRFNVLGLRLQRKIKNWLREKMFVWKKILPTKTNMAGFCVMFI